MQSGLRWSTLVKTYSLHGICDSVGHFPRGSLSHWQSKTGCHCGLCSVLQPAISLIVGLRCVLGLTSHDRNPETFSVSIECLNAEMQCKDAGDGQKRSKRG